MSGNQRAITPIVIRRAVNEHTRRREMTVEGVSYTLHVTKNREVIATDSQDYSRVYAIISLDFYNQLLAEKEGNT